MQAPAVVEIPLSMRVLRQHDQKILLLDCELDGAHRERSVHLQTSSGKPPAEPLTGNAELLIHADSETRQADGEVGRAILPRVSQSLLLRGRRSRSGGGLSPRRGLLPRRSAARPEGADRGEQRELDRLWKELDFVTQSVETLLRGFVWFERAERHVLHDKRFDFLRSEDPLLVEEELLSKFERLYLEKLGVKLVDDAIEPQQPSPQFDLIHGFFEQVRAGLAEYQQTLARAEEPALADLERLAERAYCRPLRPTRPESLRSALPASCANRDRASRRRCAARSRRC